MSIFDQIKIADDLETAAIDTLNLWFHTYTREYELQAGLLRDSFPLPRAFITSERLDREDADQLPAVVVVSPGLWEKPRQEGSGQFRAKFSLAIGIFVAGQDRTTTKRLLRVYCGIARTIMLQKQSLGGFADGTTWLDESYDDAFQFTDTQTVGAGQVVFAIEVAGVVNRYGGPPTPIPPDPDTQPGSDWPTVEEHTETVRLLPNV